VARVRRSWVVIRDHRAGSESDSPARRRITGVAAAIATGSAGRATARLDREQDHDDDRDDDGDLRTVHD
jgi:hypothetical protein